MGKKYFQHSLSKQFNDRCINMSAWARKRGFSQVILAQISAGERKGKRKGDTQNIIVALIKDGFKLDKEIVEPLKKAGIILEDFL